MALDALQVELSVVLGRTQVPLHRMLRMGRGAILALDPGEADMVEILANDLPIARGRVSVAGGAVRVEVTELVLRQEVTREPGRSLGDLRPAAPPDRAAA